MEILMDSFPSAFDHILKKMPPSTYWRDFVYCHTITALNEEFCRVDQFDAKHTNPSFWNSSPSNVVHLAQNEFEQIMHRFSIKNDASSIQTMVLGHEVVEIIPNQDSVVIVAQKQGESQQIFDCKYLIACDGANSFIRKRLGIELQGVQSMQSLLNVHFSCQGLHKLLTPRPAMLYFTFNERMVAVFVSHDVRKDEWVCQIPFFPPYQTTQDFDHSTLQDILKCLLFGKGEHFRREAAGLQIAIHSVNAWTMHAQVAASYSNSNDNIFLVGDAAHRFPPAGGFGLNTGIQDAHNIAWKLAAVYHQQAESRLLSHTYEAERKPVAEANTAASIVNYEQSATSARLLGVDPKLATLVVHAADASMLWHAGKKQLVSAALSVGLASLRWLRDWRGNALTGQLRVKLLQRQVARGESLRLVFPLQDGGFRYGSGGVQAGGGELVGGRVPHCWLRLETAAEALGEGKNPDSMISSVLLPSLMQKMLRWDSLPVTLVVSCEVDHLLPLIEKEVAAVNLLSLQLASFAVAHIAAHHQDQQPFLLSHEALQERCQRPRYSISGSEVDGNIEASPFTLKESHYSITHSNETVKLRDVTNRWSEVMGVKDGVSIVALRPDGHVCSILSGQFSIVLFRDFLLNIADVL
eukprot:CAMPEP_0170060760 /NCGR_PEP_ID=MMETSP0019_2-20121128/2585_1 /TAXON_ID=98059 /ORGANISM="Dinobryon sp., Strain UTEXLB2267" /LENGTH=636 /DNA_ID=CAMNT_0010266427 /DNA_START=95 /DNA_END=2002 /DNA_ORIENTATION=+